MRNIIPALQVHSHDASLISFKVNYTSYRGQEKEKWRDFVTLNPGERVVQVYKKYWPILKKAKAITWRAVKSLSWETCC